MKSTFFKKYLIVVPVLLIVPALSYAYNVTSVTVSQTRQNIQVAPSGYAFLGWTGSGALQIQGVGTQTLNLSYPIGSYYFLAADETEWNCIQGSADPFTDCNLPSDLSLWYGTASLTGSGHSKIWSLSGYLLSPPQATNGGNHEIIYNSQPVINFTKRYSLKSLAGVVNIDYEATDKDDDIPRPQFALDENPVNIYYAMGLTDWILLAGPVAASGTVSWDTTKLKDGSNYKLKAVVVDKGNFSNLVTEDVITIDNTRPMLTVATTPTFSRGNPVTITVTSSEALTTQPRLMVAQYKHAPVLVPFNIDERKMKFTASYEPISGFDGPATVTVTAADEAGNNAEVSLDNADFRVGMKPPALPRIDTPLDGFKTSSTTLPLLSGTAINAMKVRVVVNNGREYVISNIKKDGHFAIENIELDPRYHKGKNTLSITSEDALGSVSGATVVSVLVNSPPEIKLLEPKSRVVELNGLVDFSWSAIDINDDPLTFQVELSNDGGASWNVLARNLRESHYIWNSVTMPDSANYMARITAGDGSLTTTVLSNRLTLANALPIITLDASDNLFTSKKSKIIHGNVRSKKDLLVKLELSLDGEKTWKPILPLDGAWDSSFENFEIPFDNLKIGTIEIALRGTSAKNRVILNAQGLKVTFDDVNPTFRVDTLPTAIITKRFITLNGVAKDNFSGIKRVEYSIDDGEWYESFLHGQIGAREIEFITSTRIPLKDGEHTIRMRAVDRAENQSETQTQHFTIDATAPRIGSFMLEHDGQIMYPDMQGFFTVATGTTLNFTVAIAGKPAKVTLRANDDVLAFGFDTTTGLWKSSFMFKRKEMINLTIVAIDGVGNTINKRVAVINSTSLKNAVTPLPTPSPTVRSRHNAFDEFFNFLKQ